MLEQLASISAVMARHETELDLTRLATFLRLYAAYRRDHGSTSGAETAPVPLETFVLDRALLETAAAVLRRSVGSEVPVPSPLGNEASRVD